MASETTQAVCERKEAAQQSLYLHSAASIVLRLTETPLLSRSAALLHNNTMSTAYVFSGHQAEHQHSLSFHSASYQLKL